MSNRWWAITLISISCVLVISGCASTQEKSSSLPQKTEPQTTDTAQVFRNYFEADEDSKYEAIHIDYMVDCFVKGLEGKISTESVRIIEQLDDPETKGWLSHFGNRLNEKDGDLFNLVKNHCFISGNDIRNNPIAETDREKAISSVEWYATEYSLSFAGINPEALAELDIENYYPQLNHTTGPLTSDAILRSASVISVTPNNVVVQTRDNQTGICYFAEVTIELTSERNGTTYRFYKRKGEATVALNEICPLAPSPSSPYGEATSGHWGWNASE